jgi:tetratricopeptide (TPR) repeat protein
MNPERNAMQEVSDFYTSSYLQEKTTYVNHVWFFWANELDKFDTLKFKPVTIENLNKAAQGELLIYDTHYSHRLAGDVPLKWFKDHKEWEELCRFISSDNGFQCAFYQKTDSTNKGKLKAHNVFVENHPDNSIGRYYRGAYFQQTKDYKSALLDYNEALKDTVLHFTPMIYFNRGLSHFSLRDFPSAVLDFKKNFEMRDTVADAVFNISSCFTNMGKLDSSLYYLNKAIEVNPKYENAYINKAKLLKGKNRSKEALEALNKVIEINPKNESAILERAQIHFENKRWKECAENLSLAIGINAKKANNYFIRGMCYQNIKQNDLSCKDWEKAKYLGDARAVQYLKFYCK